uniref:Coiled-coil domain-containing protein 89-like n=1 Tax=Phallusia mammillata TaxID=59560 RepID=A0A6F9D9A2_9ASCI|nr:coiled-coil domain-containing protein 89-like [Phallusia mammillata]
MASPTRKPEDLRKIVDSHQTVGDSTTSHKAEYNNETAMLRSRIDEQGQLICILKQRADEHLNRNKTLEGINRELELLHNQARDECKDLKKSCIMLEKRFNELAENHEEMIKIKDTYKSRNVQLEKENKCLREDNKNLFSCAIEERDTEILKLLGKLKECNEHVQLLQKSEVALKKELDDVKKTYCSKIRKLESDLEDKQLHLKLLIKEMDEIKKCNQNKDIQENETITNLRKDKESLIQQVMQRGKLVQERQSENEALQSQVDKLDEQIQHIQEEFSRKQHLVDMNARVKKLQIDKDDAVTELEQLHREFQAYKLHTNNLLSKERDLNAKLRNNLFAS